MLKSLLPCSYLLVPANDLKRKLSQNQMESHGFHIFHQSTLSNGCNEELSNEKQIECREVASELRIIGDSLERDYFNRRGLNDSKRILIGATLLGIATNIVIGYLSRVFFA